MEVLGMEENDEGSEYDVEVMSQSDDGEPNEDDEDEDDSMNMGDGTGLKMSNWRLCWESTTMK